MDAAQMPANGPRLEEASARLADAWRTFGLSTAPLSSVVDKRRAAAGDKRVPARVPSVKGPLGPGSDWVVAKAGEGASALAVAKLPRADDICYELVNFIDGTRTVSEIRDAVSAEFSPIPLAAVTEYLDLLAKIGAITIK